MKTVAAAIIRRNDRVLICQRSLSGSFPGKWEFPGGKIEPGESPRAGLRRELQEELSIDAEIGAEVWRTEHQYSERSSLLLLFYSIDSYRGTEVNRVFQTIEWVAMGGLLGFDFLEADLGLVERIAAGAVPIPPTQKMRDIS